MENGQRRRNRECLHREFQNYVVAYNGRKDSLLIQQKILEDNSDGDRPDGEQPTIYHIVQTKRRLAEMTIYCLRDEEGQMHITPRGITQTVTTFLRKMYAIIVVIFNNCNWVVPRWQWLFNMYTKYVIGY